MATGIIRGVLEKVDTIHMVKSIILDKVDRLDGWMMARDSVETVLGLTWNIILAEVIWKEISTEQEIQNIILKKIKVQRDIKWSEMIKKKRKELARQLLDRVIFVTRLHSMIVGQVYNQAVHINPPSNLIRESIIANQKAKRFGQVQPQNGIN